MSLMANPTLVKNVKTQGMTTDKACAFHQVKVWIQVLIEVINDASDEYTKLFEVWRKEQQQSRKRTTVMLNEYEKLDAKWSRLKEKEKNAGG